MKRTFTMLLLALALGTTLAAPVYAQEAETGTPVQEAQPPPAGEMVSLTEVEQGDAGVTGEDVGLVDSPADPTIIGSPTGADAELQAALELIIKMASDLTFVPAAAALVVVLTALLKRFLPVNPAYIALALQGVVWVVWILAKHFGYEQQFSNVIDTITTIASALAGLVISTSAATKAYSVLKAQGAPILGDSQP